MGYSFRVTARFLLYIYIHHPTDRIIYTTAFVTQVMEHWLERDYKVKLYCGVVLSVINDIRSVARPCIHLNKGENGEIHRYIEADIFIERRGGKGDSYREVRKDRNVLFNDTLDTFYLRLYGVRHMVKDHSDSVRGNLLLPHGLLFPISSKGSFYVHFPT